MKIVSLFAIPALLLAANLPAQPAEKGQTFRNGDVAIYYEVRGSGTGTPLVLVNGGPGFGHAYLHSTAAWDTLARSRRVVFYDQRGTGLSGALKEGESCNLADQIADLEALRVKLGAEKIDLLGHSWGGYLAMAYAARHADRIAHLAIIDSAAPKWGDTLFFFKEFFPESMARQDALAFADELGDKAATNAIIMEYFATLFYDPAHRDAFLAQARDFAYTREVNQKLNTDLARYDLNPELAKLRMPALVATGRFDINVAPVVAYRIHKAIPGSSFVVFEKSGHLPWFEEPDAFVKVIEEFLGR